MMTTGHELRRALRGPLGRPAADAVSDAISGVQTCLRNDIEGVRTCLQQDIAGVRVSVERLDSIVEQINRVVGQIDRLRVVIIATGVAVFMGLSGVALAFVLLMAR
jgi:hypothetical protein